MPRILVIEARKTKKLSQSSLAKLMGVSPSDISRVELGYMDPTPEIAKGIVSILGVRLVDIDNGLPRARRGVTTKANEGLHCPGGAVHSPRGAAVAQSLGERLGGNRNIAPSSHEKAASIVPDYDQVPDLSMPASFYVTPDYSVLESSNIGSDAAKGKILKALKYSQAILHTSRVPAAVWIQWRTFEKAAENKLRQL